MVLCCHLFKGQPEMGVMSMLVGWLDAAGVAKVGTDQCRKAGHKLVMMSSLTLKKIFLSCS